VVYLAIVYCSITGFGQTGPRKDQAGYDFLLQGMSGLMSITGDPQGHPMKVGVAIVDIMTGLYATSSILAALLERDAQSEGKREGQHIDLSLFDVSVAFLANQVFLHCMIRICYSFLFSYFAPFTQASNYLVSGKAPQRLGNYHPNIAPYQVRSRASPSREIASVWCPQTVNACPACHSHLRHRTATSYWRWGTTCSSVSSARLLANPNWPTTLDLPPTPSTLSVSSASRR
jgi:crotonobetainyl-CoA:carnitine CoA-transferase CaiB-like acyl-CoA transferase